MTSDAEERVRILEAEVARLKVMLESAPSFVMRLTLDGNFLYLNRLQPGFRMEDVLGTSVDGYIPPRYREQAHRAMQAAIETKTVQEYATMASVAPDRMGHYLIRLAPIIEDGAVTSLVMVGTDVTMLEEQRILLQLALDATGLGTYTHSLEGHGGRWDDAARRILGAPPGASVPGVEAFMRDSLHPDDYALVSEALKRAATEPRYGPVEYRVRHQDGSVRWINASGVAIRNDEGKNVRIVGTVEDITERRTLEARLREAEKLESIGRLAGGVAHDFNNMLTAILGNVAFASRATSLEESRQLLDEIRIAAERSAALTAQLLAFARRQLVETKVVNPNELIRRLEPLLRRLLGERVRANFSLAATGHLRVGESQLEQVVMNLFANARDALVRGGTVTLETRDVTFEQPSSVADGELPAGTYVMLLVKDDGPGIPAEALPHVFEPFFTTRETGTGLGLATCYGIVKQFGGHIRAESEPGHGATFVVYLPWAEPERTGSTVPESGGRLAATARLLVVEDEPAVRRVLERTLAHTKAAVVVANNAEEALSLVASAGPFDLVVTDIVMPDIDGRELARRLRAQAPELKILFISGYAQEFQRGNESADGSVAFLGKPFEPNELVAAVRRLLGMGAPRRDGPKL